MDTVDEKRKGAHSRHPTDSDLPFHLRYACPVNVATVGSGISRAQLYKMIKAGEVETCGVGRLRLVVIPSLLAALKQTGPQSCPPPPNKRVKKEDQQPEAA